MPTSIWTDDQVSQFLVVLLFIIFHKIRSFISVLRPKQRVITKAYGVQATTIEGQNALAPVLCFMYTCKFHVKDRQNMLNQITSDRRSKRAWSKCILCIPYILSESPNECWLYTCDACVITTWRLRLQAPLVTRNYFAKFLPAYFRLIWEIYNLSLTSVICSTVPFKSKLTLDSQSSGVENWVESIVASQFLIPARLINRL